MFEFLLKRRIKTLCLNNIRQKVFRNLKEIRTVLLLFDSNNHEEANDFIRQLKSLGKKVNVCGYKAKDDKKDYSKISSNMITEKENTDWMGAPSPVVMAGLKKESYDALIDLTIKENLTLEYLVAFMDVPLKVGYKKNQRHLYDLTIAQLPEMKKKNYSEVKELGNQILYYLNTIHSKVTR